jgi:hypothetical protein
MIVLFSVPATVKALLKNSVLYKEVGDEIVKRGSWRTDACHDLL